MVSLGSGMVCTLGVLSLVHNTILTTIANDANKFAREQFLKVQC